MSTPLTDSINALTAYANEVTGQFDTNLSDAVHTLASGYGGGVTSGTYTPTSDGASFSIDTGVTGWTHFLIVAHTLPYATPMSRCLGSRYFDATANYVIATYGSSSDTSAKPSAGSSYDSGNNLPSVSGSVITSGGAASQVGSLQAGTQYDWYAW